MAKIRTILCPTDFSEFSKAALEHAEEFARQADAELIVAHIVEPALYPTPPDAVPVPESLTSLERRARDVAEEELRDIVADSIDRGVRCRSLVGFGSPYGRIVKMAEEEKADLLVIATHGNTGLKHFVLGSTAERVVRTCPCPVLTVKAATISPEPEVDPAASARAGH